MPFASAFSFYWWYSCLTYSLYYSYIRHSDCSAAALWLVTIRHGSQSFAEWLPSDFRLDRSRDLWYLSYTSGRLSIYCCCPSVDYTPQGFRILCPYGRYTSAGCSTVHLLHSYSRLSTTWDCSRLYWTILLHCLYRLPYPIRCCPHLCQIAQTGRYSYCICLWPCSPCR